MFKLDPRQQAAVDAGPIDVFISAGAGSGKTRVLAARFLHAVLGVPPYEPAQPEAILTVTFTEKAAAELAERIRGALIAEGRPDAARQLGEAWISTIHGMCSRILRQNVLKAGTDPHFTVLDAIEASVLAAEAEEDVLRRALSENPSVTALVDAYDFKAVSTALHTVLGSVRALGQDVGMIQVVSQSEVMAKLGTITQQFYEVEEALAGLRQIKAVQANRDRAREIAALLTELASGKRSAREGLALLSTTGFRACANVDGLTELIEEAKGLIKDGRACAAQLCVAGHEAAFLALLQSYADKYTQLKREAGALDFEDLQVETARLLEKNPEVSERLRSRFAMIMIDEFQDTNALQLRIAEKIARGNLCTVGDENQSIYAFRHADVEVFRARGRAVGASYKLDINYRIAEPLLHVLNEVFAHPALLGSGYMALSAPAESSAREPWPLTEPRFEARFIDWSSPCGADSREVEAECIAECVAARVAAGVAPGDIAVLMGAMSGRAPFVERALARRGIAALLASGGTFFECQEIIETRALLRVIDNVWDDSALITVLGGRLTGLSAEALGRIRDRGNSIARAEEGREPVYLWDAIADGDAGLDDAEEAHALARTVAAIADARRRRGLRPLRETVLEPLMQLDVDLACFAGVYGESRAWANILKLADLASEYEEAAGGDLRGFLEYLGLRELHATGEQEATLETGFGAVRVMSIHAAKGLEFPVVVVGGLMKDSSIGPIVVKPEAGVSLLGMKLYMNEEHEDTEREETLGWRRVADVERASRGAEDKRLLYVACTRAQEGLSVVARTDPQRPAGTGVSEALRAALGFGAAGAFETRGSDAQSTVQSECCDNSAANTACVTRISLVAPETVHDSGSSEPLRNLRASLHGHEELLARAHSVLLASPASQCLQNPALAVRKPVSYTGLASYQRCPYQYFLTRVMRLAPPPAPGPDALTLGTAVHSVLEHYTSAESDLTGWIAQASAASGLDAEAQQRLQRAVETYRALPVAAQVFAAERVTREAPIAVPLGDAVLSGAIDVLAWDGDSALVVDYKTGTSPLSAEDAKTRYRLQGECYALAALLAGARSVTVVFAEVERRRETHYAYTAADQDALEAHLGSIIEKIGCGEFPPRESYDPYCCEVCPGLGTLCSITRPSKDAAQAVRTRH